MVYEYDAGNPYIPQNIITWLRSSSEEYQMFVDAWGHGDSTARQPGPAAELRVKHDQWSYIII